MTSPPRVDDDVDVVPGESLFGILRDFLRVRIENVVPALHDVDRDFVFQDLGVLKKGRSVSNMPVDGGTHVFQNIFSHHVGQFCREFDTGRSTSADNKRQ
jgi:hypothetical protein